MQVKEVDERSLYVTPFPQDVGLDALQALCLLNMTYMSSALLTLLPPQAFFSNAAPVNAVRMRRHTNSKEFKGSIFVEFKDAETAKEVGVS